MSLKLDSERLVLAINDMPDGHKTRISFERECRMMYDTFGFGCNVCEMAIRRWAIYAII